MLKYKRESGSIIEIKDTPAMRKLAENLGWKEVKKAVKKKAKDDGDSVDSNT